MISIPAPLVRGLAASVTAVAVATATAILGPATAVASPARAAAPVTDTCPGAKPEVTVFKEGGVPVLDWRENLEFDGRGTLWVSHAARGVEGYRPDGTRYAAVDVPSPAGIRRGPDGAMYVNYGQIPVPNGSGIMRFDPRHPERAPEKVVDGLLGINGLAIDGAGNFYLGREFAPTVLKLRPDGSRDERWTAAADVFGTNGLAVADGTLYTTSTVHPRSPVEAVPLDDPGAHRRLADLSGSPLDFKGLDDLTVVGDHLYAVAFVTGQIIRVDRGTGAACVVVAGLHGPTSARAPLGFGSHDPQRELFVTEASGRILRVRMP
ncbi:hypothetical protein HUT18_31575 [Streptomyces sp. NA04227]|uniref:hypothetical protein n=1 Tax=Streptomyces sp. NA04227 TaxID=2742136 RepID=UPI00158FFA35|nr:hypothetical protein [Streptomyces sp. NA04227]QKW10273.1 hypothetical protein HUT18_31575 [Streptomyces sp. NA04227]